MPPNSGSPKTNRTRRDFVKAIGGALGGVSLLAPGLARGQAIASIPSGYKFYRVLTANQGGSFGPWPNTLGTMTGSVMMASPLSGGGLGSIYLHGQHSNLQRPSLFRVTVNYDSNPPTVTRVIPEATEQSQLLGTSLTIDHIGVGACNALGQYVTTLQPAGNPPTPATSPGVFVLTPGEIFGSWRRIVSFADPAPDGSFYGGDFGDVAVDDNENLLLVAATTQAPGGSASGFSGSQALVSTSVGGNAQARVVLRTGDLLPFAPAAIQSVGLIDLAPENAFAAQVTAHRLHSGVGPGTALVVGNTQRGIAEHRVVAASPAVLSPQAAGLLNVSSGDTYLGARVDPRQSVGFVTHLSAFEQSIGSNDVQDLGYFSRPRWRRLGRTQPLGTTNEEVISYNAPCISNTGLVYETELLGDSTSQLRISDGVNSDIILRSGDLIPGVSPAGNLFTTEIFFGQHATQVDAFGRLAFTAEFLINSDPSQRQNPSNVITALVIGIPL